MSSLEELVNLCFQSLHCPFRSFAPKSKRLRFGTACGWRSVHSSQFSVTLHGLEDRVLEETSAEAPHRCVQRGATERQTEAQKEKFRTPGIVEKVVCYDIGALLQHRWGRNRQILGQQEQTEGKESLDRGYQFIIGARTHSAV